MNETEKLLMAIALALEECWPEKSKALRKIAMGS